MTQIFLLHLSRLLYRSRFFICRNVRGEHVVTTGLEVRSDVTADVHGAEFMTCRVAVAVGCPIINPLGCEFGR